MSSYFPYADRYPPNRVMPDTGRDPGEILDELRAIAGEEDRWWEAGTCSGTMYCGDHEHYAFLAEAFGLFAHANALQRDMVPSATRFEGEVIAMTLDMLHGEAVTDTTPGGLVTSGGTASIAHAVLAYRDAARAAGRVGPLNLVKPETGHPAFDKACHLFGLELRIAPVDPATATVDVDAVAGLVDDGTVALVGSACNYGYGTVDDIAALSDLALDRGVGLHVDGCLGGFILPWGRELGHDIPVFDFRLRGVTTISADTHKYGYAFKGSSVVLFRDVALRNAQYFHLTDWSGGKYCSPSMDGSRSVGLLASTWASLVRFGRQGYLEHARRIFATADAMKEAVRSHPELRIIGQPTFCFSFTGEGVHDDPADDIDIYLVNDRMRTVGWRFNGQQYPDAIHMAVTRPQTQPGVADRFAADLAEAVAWARAHPEAVAESGAVYGGVVGGMNAEADEFIRMVMADMMDHQLSVPE
jgi:glutamate/tyrosine decarboxylase-like PLP-dependent enzyme